MDVFVAWHIFWYSVVEHLVCLMKLFAENIIFSGHLPVLAIQYMCWQLFCLRGKNSAVSVAAENYVFVTMLMEKIQLPNKVALIPTTRSIHSME